MAVPKAVAFLGIGRDNLHYVPCDDSYRMVPSLLERAIRQDEAQGREPIAVVASAGKLIPKAEKSDMRRALVVCVVLAMVLSLPRFIEAIVMMDPTVSVPVNRLIINTTKYIKAHPKDSQGYYLLGRLHSFAFAGNTHTEESKYSRLFGPNALPEARFIEPVPRQERAVPGKILPAAARWHLNESLRNYQRATELQPKQPLAYLGLGWMLEQGTLFVDQVDAPF
jgi:hypothetical protein